MVFDVWPFIFSFLLGVNMKKISTLALPLLLAGMASLALADDSATKASSAASASAPATSAPDAKASYSGAITINPLSLIFGLLDAQYEMRLDSGSSLAFRGDFLNLSLLNTSYSAYGAGLAYRMYPGHEALHHFYW